MNRHIIGSRRLLVGGDRLPRSHGRLFGIESSFVGKRQGDDDGSSIGSDELQHLHWERVASIPVQFLLAEQVCITELRNILPPSRFFLYISYIQYSRSRHINSSSALPIPLPLLLYRSWKLLYLKSEFVGQLPRPFDPSPNGTRTIPANMNDLNREEPSRYVCIRLSSFSIFLAAKDLLLLMMLFVRLMTNGTS